MFADHLGVHPDIAVVAAIGHEDAMAWPDERWRQVDVAVIDAANYRHAHDQFPGVAVVRRIRSVRSGAETQVIIVTAQFFHDGLRRRMREASADFFFFREDLYKNDLIIEAVLRPDRFYDDESTMELLDKALAERLGVDSRASVDGFVRYVSDNDLYGAVEPHRSQDDRPGRRNRWWARFRTGATDAGRVRPMNRTGDPPAREQSASLGQLQALWTWATQIWPGRAGHENHENPPSQPQEDPPIVG